MHLGIIQSCFKWSMAFQTNPNLSCGLPSELGAAFRRACLRNTPIVRIFHFELPQTKIANSVNDSHPIWTSDALLSLSISLLSRFKTQIPSVLEWGFLFPCWIADAPRPVWPLRISVAPSKDEHNSAVFVVE